MMKKMKELSGLLRLSHWSKSLFVLLGPIYAGQLMYLPMAIWAAFSFCLIASAVYIYNDIQDREEDRIHPQKCHRPIAREAVSIHIASMVLVILLLAGFGLAYSISIDLATILAVYLLINLLYNHYLRQIAVLDVLCIAFGFLLRVLAGTIGIGLVPSYWLLVTVTLISLFIALCKRKLEKQWVFARNTRIVLKRYTASVLDTLIIATGALSFITYFLYIVIVRNESFYFVLTLPFAFIGLWRFARITTRIQETDDPVALFLSDRLSRLNFICFLCLTFIALFA